MAAPGIDGKPRGFGYVEFETVDGLKNALTATGSDLQGRSIRVSVAEAKESRFGRADEASTWERSGPLPSLGGRSGGFGAPRTGGFGGSSGGGGYEEVERDAPLRGGKFVPSEPPASARRMFSDREPSRADEGSWERRGPTGLPPRAGGPGAGQSSFERTLDRNKS